MKKRKLFLNLALALALTTSTSIFASSAFSRLEAESKTASSGIQIENCREGGKNVAYINNNDWIKLNGVNFGNGASKLNLRVASNTNGGKIEIRLGSPKGTLIGTATVGRTGGWQSWKTISCNIQKTTGTKDVYLVFKGGSGYLFNVNWVQFVATTQTETKPEVKPEVKPETKPEVKPETKPEVKPEAPSVPVQNGTIYQVIQGHDGDPDPDDNGAALAGYMAIKRNSEKSSNKVQYLGFVYGDTTEKRQNGMINGGGGSYHGSNGFANYKFYKQYTVPALKSVGCTAFYDTTPQTYNFNATSLSQMTTSGQFVANKILWAINNSNANTKYRVVYSAGGGMNVPAEAVKYLKNKGIKDSVIIEHFLAVQHSKWNFESATEKVAQNIIRPFYTAITDQNGPVGLNKGVPTSVSEAKTSKTFANAWRVAVAGQKPSPAIPGFGSINDISDAGSHSYCSNIQVLNANWYKRNNGFNNRVNYTQYNVARVKADLCN